MDRVILSLSEAYALAYHALISNGFSEQHAVVIAKTLPPGSATVVPRTVYGDCWGLLTRCEKGKSLPMLCRQWNLRLRQSLRPMPKVAIRCWLISRHYRY